MENKVETEIVEEFEYDGFGVPVVFVNVTVVKICGEWVPKVNLERAMHQLAIAIAQESPALSGNEVRFVRHLYEMTLQAFGARFGVSHAAVVKWEKCGDAPTKMGWALEKELRMFVLACEGVECGEFKRVWESLSVPVKRPRRRSKPVRLDYGNAAPAFS